MKLRHVASIAEVPGAEWDALFPDGYPFTRHAFLDALERHGCVGASEGWEPCHLLAEDDGGRLVGAVPLYLKTHSYGEFVFDWSWADASHRIGRNYYPKLLSAIPFTPAAGPRLGGHQESVRQALAEAIQHSVEDNDLSSAHILFTSEADNAVLERSDYLTRLGVQFQWRNDGYAGFSDFAAQLSSDKRKKLMRERRRVSEAGLHFRHRRGDELSESEWRQVYELYSNTYAERGQAPYLTFDFFNDYGRRAETPFRLICGYDGDRQVAVAICLEGADTLYGRNWGASGYYHSLHFETCYYQGIDYCIEAGLARFDAGVQGGHKLARGFDPVVTRSAHRLQDPRLHAAVDQYLRRERAAVEAQRWELLEHSAFRVEEQEMQRSRAE